MIFLGGDRDVHPKKAVRLSCFPRLSDNKGKYTQKGEKV